MLNRLFLLCCILLSTLSLSACITTTPFPAQPTATTSGTDQARAQQAEKQGDFSAAGKYYLRYAATLSSPQKDQVMLQAAYAFSQANHPQKALDTLSKVNRDQLSYVQQLDATILEARILNTNNQSSQALRVLAPYDLSRALPSQQKSALRVKITALDATGNMVEKAYSHIALDPLLSAESEEKSANQHALWQALMWLDPAVLRKTNPGRSSAIGSGWFSLAEIIKTHKGQDHARKVAIADWQRDHPNHPANHPDLHTGKVLPSIITERSSPTAGTSFITDSVDASNIALLLPESGPYAGVAQAIRQGFTAAHYANNAHAQINFYGVNTSRGSSNVWEQYQQAVMDGASVIVGPLNKASLEILSQSGPLTVPVLALNRLNDNVYVDNLYQFGLAPEDEARSIADFAQSRGYYRTLILAPENEWGSRIVNAFNDQWLMTGGDVVDIGWYDTKNNDFASVIRPLMKHRGAADFVFLVARPQLARQLMPQLRFHYLKRMPVLATSHIYNGQENPRQDIDLNPIYTTDMPWIFKGIAENDPAYQQLISLKPKDLNSLKRFYALGVDAYRLIPKLNELSQFPGTTFDGASGQLSINESGHVRRKTITGQFKKGILTPLLTRTTYQ